MPEHNPLVRRLKVVPVPQTLCWRRAIVVERHHLGRDELAVEAETEHVSAGCRQHKPNAVDRLSLD